MGKLIRKLVLKGTAEHGSRTLTFGAARLEAAPEFFTDRKRCLVA